MLNKKNRTLMARVRFFFDGKLVGGDAGCACGAHL